MHAEGVEQDKFAIHEAAQNGRLSVVEALLKASPKLADQRDDDGRLPIHWAVSFSHIDIVKLLASTRTFDPDVKDSSGWTPLMIAVSLTNGDELLDLLLHKGSDVNVQNYAGQRAIHFVASKKNIHFARRLLEHNPPASLRCSDVRKQYPIHRAAAVGSVPMLELFIKHKSPVNVADIAGQTPLHHAVAEGHGDAAMALLKAGADPRKEDSDGNPALKLAPDSQVVNFIVKNAELEGVEL
ncbi:hypothetical protein K3495_g1006 [Podosphaera aphanis]|nr:hypothetical protein K3495_g1006 [Podosphaera aphanis]